MGTNFYWHHGACGHCGRVEVSHVGKRSAGWSFGFRGYRHDPEDGLLSPFGRPVLSRSDWAMVFSARGRLFDEYGAEMANPGDWLDALEPPTPERKQWEDEERSRGRWHDPNDPRDWRDALGFRFYDGEFS